MDIKNYIFERLHSGPLFKRNERDYSMFWLSSFGDAHTKANEKWANNSITLAFVIFKNMVSSYYRLAGDDENLMIEIVKNIQANPQLKGEIFKDYSDAGDRLFEMYDEIEKREEFDKEFIRELSFQMNKILIGQICILHRADSFVKHFGVIPGLPEEIMELRKKYESAFGLFETNLEKIFKKVMLNVKDATLQDFKLLTPEELIESIISGELPKEKIEERKGLAIMNYLPEPQILVENLAQEVYLEIRANEEKYNPSLNSKEITGQTVYQAGVIKGVCKVITDYDQVKTLEEGFILVTPSTLPKYNDIYKRAKAIITNEGGILSHVAILSREFKIPAVFGTKIATQVLKDGIEVEIDTEKGVIRIIK